METTQTKQKQMEILQSPPSRPLLEESLESLCRQSNLWLDIFDYWNDELRFFNNLIGKKLFQYVTEKKRSTLSQALEGIAGAEYEMLRASVRQHENQLLLILSGKSGDETFLRRQHSLLAQRMNEAENRFKALKLLVLDFGQISADNFFNGNETLQVIHERRAVRTYLPDPVPRIHIQNLLKAACMAPSALNLQPWSFYVVTDPAKIKRYGDAVKVEVGKVYPDILGLFGEEKDPIFHGAPVVIFITVPANSEWGALDTGFCAQNLMLAAKSMGYDSCPVGLAAFIEKTGVYHELCVSPSEKVMLSVIIGKGAECPAMHPRKTGNVKFVA